MAERQERKAAFELIDGIILVPGAIKDTSGYFAIDTGAVQTVLNRIYCASAPGSEIKEALTFNGGMKPSDISTGSAEKISVAGWEITLSSALTMDMDYVERPLRKGRDDLVFLGSIGADILGTGLLLIDYPNKQLDFCVSKIPEHAKRVKMIIEKLPTVELEIQQRTFRFVMDTGANHFVMDREAVPMGAIVASSDKDAPQMLKSLHFAGREYRNITGMTADLSAVRDKLQAQVDGIIGYQLLKEYLCCFDYKNEWRYLAPRC